MKISIGANIFNGPWGGGNLFFKNIGLAGGFLFIVANGTKEWSVDREKKYVRL